MNTETLKALGLDDEQIKSVMVEHGKVVNPLKQEKVELEQQRDAINTQLADVTGKLDEAQKGAEKGSDLEKQINDLQTQLADSKAKANEQLKATKKSYEIDSALKEYGAKNAKAVMALIDSEKVNFDDNGKLIGLTEQLDGVKKENGFLFNDTDGASPKPRISTSGNPDPNAGGGETSLQAKIAARMSGGE